MLPGIRLVIAAIIASVILMIGGFGLVATFQIAKTSIGAPPRGAAPPDPALADRPERNKVYASTGTPRINEGAPVVDMPSTHTAVASSATNSTPARRSDNEDAVVRTPTNFGAASPPVSPSRSDDTGPDQISGIDARPERGPAVVALTEDVAPAIENPSASAAAATAPTESSDKRPAGTAPTINVDNASAPSIEPAAILSTPDVAAAAVPPSPEHEAMETASPSRTVPEVGSSSTPAETTVAARPSHIAGETTAAGPRSTSEDSCYKGETCHEDYESARAGQEGQGTSGDHAQGQGLDRGTRTQAQCPPCHAIHGSASESCEPVRKLLRLTAGRALAVRDRCRALGASREVRSKDPFTRARASANLAPRGSMVRSGNTRSS